MASEKFATHKTEFPQNPRSPVQLYTALYNSQVQTIVQRSLLPQVEDRTILTITGESQEFSGCIPLRNVDYREVYFCGPLTSAGAIRIPGNQGSTFRQNVMVAETFRDALIPHLTSDDGLQARLTIPGHIGVRDQFLHGIGWGEGDYNLFWLFYLSGIPPEVAQLFSESKSTREAVIIINNKKLNRDQYKPAYQGMVDSFVTLVNSSLLKGQQNKVARLVTLPDSQHSFGSQMEIRLARGLGIPIEEARVNPLWVRQQQQLWFNQHTNLNKLDGTDFVLPIDDLANNIALSPLP